MRWLLIIWVPLLGCGDSDTKADTASEVAETDTTPEEVEVVDVTGKSLYRIEFTFNDQPFVVERDLTGLDQYFAFGSTHIAPAVSFGMTDSIQFPRTMTIGINFGVIVPSGDHPIQTEGTGNYPFSDDPPSIDLFIGGLQYRSTVSGASGAIDIAEWGVETGDTVSGTYQGTLMSEGATGRTIDVTGFFHFVLPDKQDGQPQ